MSACEQTNKDERRGQCRSGFRRASSRLPFPFPFCPVVPRFGFTWKLSAFLGTMNPSGSSVFPASLNPLATSFSDVSSARRGRKLMPRWATVEPCSERGKRLSSSREYSKKRMFPVGGWAGGMKKTGQLRRGVKEERRRTVSLSGEEELGREDGDVASQMSYEGGRRDRTRLTRLLASE